ncbi:MAG: PHB depolymerase family esterase [Pseudomonadota bacterium]
MRLLFLSLLLCLAGCATTEPAAYPYRAYLPPGYDANPAANYPLILFLHGANPSLPAESTIPDVVHAQLGLPFIVLAPRSNEEWSAARLELVLAEVEKQYRIDPRRRYLTGLSMGARGAANLGSRLPSHFAALVLIAGAGDPARACDLKQVPVRLIHNRRDKIVRLDVSEKYRKALDRCDGRVTLSVNETLLPGQWDHDAWSGAYASAELYRWLLKQETRP